MRSRTTEVDLCFWPSWIPCSEAPNRQLLDLMVGKGGGEVLPYGSDRSATD